MTNVNQTNTDKSSEKNGEPSWEVVEAGTGGKKIGTFETEDQARKYIEDRFGKSPSPANGRIIWKGKKRPGRSRYILKLRKALTDGGPSKNVIDQLEQLHERPWSEIEGAYVRIDIEVDTVKAMYSKEASGGERYVREERKGEVVGREIGTGLYYDSDKQDLVIDSIGPAIYLSTPNDTILEIRTNDGDNELLSFDPPEQAQ